MPIKNTLRIDVPESYYHVYNRGRNKQPIFLDQDDFAFFTKILGRHLSAEPQIGKDGTIYPHLYGKLELLSYCLMGNHYHLLFYQAEKGSLSILMKSLQTSYTTYFNRKYGHSGSLFESRYKASRIDNDAYLTHISRYIHLNPRFWKLYPYSSIRYYRDKSPSPEWLCKQKISDLFGDTDEYYAFLCDYQGHRDMLNELKYELAHL